MLRRLANVYMLDDKPITAAERAAAVESVSTITPNMIRVHGRSTGAVPARTLGGGATVELAGSGGVGGGARGGKLLLGDGGGESKGGADDADDAGNARGAAGESMSEHLWGTMEQLDLNHLRLRHIQNLDRLTGLRRLSLADNELTRIEGLDQCTLLEELCLEENRILKMENMQRLVFLKKLDLGKNKLCKIENLDSLQVGDFLSIFFSFHCSEYVH